MDNTTTGVFRLPWSHKCSFLWMTTQMLYFFKHRFLMVDTRPTIILHYIKSLYVNLMESYNTLNYFYLWCIYLQCQHDISLLFQITMTKRFWRRGIFILKLDIDRPGADNVNSFHFYSSLSLTRYFESMFENYVQRFVWSNTYTFNLLLNWRV